MAKRQAKTGMTIRASASHDQFLAGDELWQLAGRYRAGFLQRGLQRGDIVAIAQPTCAESMAAVIAAWSEGMAISFLPHDIAASNSRITPEQFTQMLALLEPALLLTSRAVVPHIPGGLAEKILLQEELSDWAAGIPPQSGPIKTSAGDLAVLQLTSGSTGQPKAVEITQHMLSANCDAIASRVGANRQDIMVSWLPLHHDMGLSAITLAWWVDAQLILIPTASYARRPTIWLETISNFRATLSPAPASAYTLMTRFADAFTNRALALDSWRYAWAGAEPVHDKHVQDFIRAFSRYGLSPSTVQPAYGMAETVVATSLNRPGKPYAICWVDRAKLELAGEVQAASAGAPDAIALVSNGKAVDGVQIAVFDDAGNPCPTGRSGRLCIRGSSVIHRYHKQPVCLDQDGWFDTGDIGFLHNDEAYVCGRVKDLITRSGVNASPYQIEWVVEELLALRPGSAAAFSYLDFSSHQERVVVLVVHTPSMDKEAATSSRIAVEVSKRCGIQIDLVQYVTHSQIPKTTSGKIKRQQLRQQFAQARHSSPAAALQPQPHSNAEDLSSV
ncbi:hypothetical protein BI347_08180 [Chromobacterium sphagni]|uniref:AMP-dependent synthetase/ligase domain-containing protein n=1 Tax=Chromobacterium sphagni TaxID=1903179 RepID=A0A1S1X1T9_9NEIS|nr:AMP-binding protein [Chromobacterium sphagni]OHX13491.1 hypothetical protein BI347_08180 [Chromobacterium sphagni]